MGTVTPWILLLGYGIVDPGDLHMPHTVSVFASIDPGESLMLVLTVAFTSLATVLAFALNMFKTIAYNARAVSGTFSVVQLATIAGMCADYRNIVSYIRCSTSWRPWRYRTTFPTIAATELSSPYTPS